MNDLTIFQSEQFGTVRTLDEEGKILFCGTDVASALGYSKTHNAITRHCKNPLMRRIEVCAAPIQGITSPHETTKARKEQDMLFITEGDLYRLITHSRLPAAEAFEKWVFDEVLPTIRKTGQYKAEPEPEEPPKQTQNPKFQEALERSYNLDEEERMKRDWFNFMLASISSYYDIPSNTILHYAYKEMEKEGVNPHFLKWWYAANSGHDISTFVAVCKSEPASCELADYLTKQMKRLCIKRTPEYYP